MYSEFESIDHEADKCVKCGLCTPYCATYLLEKNENESPRGRIALMQGLASSQLPLSPALESHLDHCLACRACESVCPAGVRFGSMLDQTRQILRRAHRAALTTRVGLWAVAHAGAWRSLELAIVLSRRLGILRWIQTSNLPQRLGLTSLQHQAQLVADQTPRIRTPRRLANRRERVALFSGCMRKLLDNTTLKIVSQLFRELGYEVVLPSQHHCCGALHQHLGETKTALTLAKKNLRMFQQLKVDRIVYLSSGCGAQLASYNTLAWNDTSLRKQAKEIVAKCCDAGALTVEALTELEINLRPLEKSVAVHEPCSQRNVLRGSHHVYTLLQRIPQLRIQALADNTYCCGAAGSYLINHPDTANALLEEKLKPWRVTPTDLIVSDNAGCRAHIQRGVRNADQAVEVIHPLELVYRQLETA